MQGLCVVVPRPQMATMSKWTQPALWEDILVQETDQNTAARLKKLYARNHQGTRSPNSGV